jgi:hypothetical protein
VTDPAIIRGFIYSARVLSVPRTPGLLLLAALVEFSACTFLVDSKISQCHSNADCARFGNSVCDPDQLLCVAAPVASKPDAASAAGPDAGGPLGAQSTVDAAPAVSCQGDNGCYSCAPKTDVDFFNACTDGHCVPFDNRARLTNLAADGSLRPLP